MCAMTAVIGLDLHLHVITPLMTNAVYDTAITTADFS